jgi:hypothetical protein
MEPVIKGTGDITYVCELILDTQDSYFIDDVVCVSRIKFAHADR